MKEITTAIQILAIILILSAIAGLATWAVVTLVQGILTAGLCLAATLGLIMGLVVALAATIGLITGAATTVRD